MSSRPAARPTTTTWDHYPISPSRLSSSQQKRPTSTAIGTDGAMATCTCICRERGHTTEVKLLFEALPKIPSAILRGTIMKYDLMLCEQGWISAPLEGTREVIEYRVGGMP